MRLAAVLSKLLLLTLLTSCEDETIVDQATRDGILIIGNSNEPKGLDPHLVSGVLESNIIRALFEGLTLGHPSEDGVALPGAAARWEANGDFTVWTFHLRPDGKWSDGAPVTARDFLFSYRRLLTPTLPAEYSEMLFFIKNARAFNKGEITDFAEVGVEAVDDFTLKLTLRGPVPFLPEITKHYTWYPVPKHIVTKYGRIDTPFTDWTDPGKLVSNGPFQLKSWRVNHYFEVERNPHYWDAASVGLNGIRYLPTTNIYTEARMFLDGQIHATYTLPPEMIDYAREHIPEMLRQEPYVGVRFMRVNTRRKPLDDPKVRHALAAAIDRQSIIENILRGGQQPASGIVPPFGNYQSPNRIHFDPERARRLLEESGYTTSSGFPDITFLTTDRDSARRMAEAIQAMWREHLGINVRIVQREWITYLQRQYDSDFDICAGGWIGDYLDPTTFLEMWLADGGNNNTGWASEDYMNLLRKAENTADPAARLRTLAEAETILLEDLPVIPNYWYTTNYLLRPEVQNWHPLLLNNHPFKFVELVPSGSKVPGQK